MTFSRNVRFAVKADEFRMKAPAICTALVFALGTFQAFAAQGTLSIGGDSHTLRTNTGGGTCLVENLGADGIDVDCDDGAGNRAYANSHTGCLVAIGTGQCYSGNAPIHTNVAIDVKCGSQKYTITTGTAGGTCTTQHDTSGNTTGGGCSDATETNTSSVTCSTNNGSGSCGTATGNGSCTMKAN